MYYLFLSLDKQNCHTKNVRTDSADDNDVK
jgi:hypothetical protein